WSSAFVRAEYLAGAVSISLLAPGTSSMPLTNTALGWGLVPCTLALGSVLPDCSVRCGAVAGGTRSCFLISSWFGAEVGWADAPPAMVSVPPRRMLHVRAKAAERGCMVRYLPEIDRYYRTCRRPGPRFSSAGGTAFCHQRGVRRECSQR